MAEPPRTDLPSDFQHLLDWCAEGIRHMESIPDEQTRDEVFALLEGIDLLHRQALARFLQQVERHGGEGLLERVTHDPVVTSLLQMYDLPEEDEWALAQRALEDVLPYITSHGGNLQLVSVENGRVRVRLSGACQGCPGSTATLKRVVEEAFRARLPGFQELVEDTPPAAQGMRIQLYPRVLRRPRWVSVGPLSEVPEGELVALWPEGQGVLLVRLQGEVYAHQNGCPPGSALVLHTGQLDGTTLVCPWHRCRYDVRTGKRLDGEGKLGVLPVAVEGGQVKIAMGTEEVVA